jgi:hypothetical protein
LEADHEIVCKTKKISLALTSFYHSLTKPLVQYVDCNVGRCLTAAVI